MRIPSFFLLLTKLNTHLNKVDTSMLSMDISHFFQLLEEAMILIWQQIAIKTKRAIQILVIVIKNPQELPMEVMKQEPIWLELIDSKCKKLKFIN